MKKFDLLNPHKLLAMSEKELESACQNLIQIYSELQPSLYFEMLQLKVSFEKDFKDKPAITIRDFVNLLYITYNSVASSFPNVLAAMFIFLSLPVTTATAERSFSKLKLIKNFLRSQMSQDKLDGLSMLSIEAEKANLIDQSKVALTFARAKVRKVPMFV